MVRGAFHFLRFFSSIGFFLIKNLNGFMKLLFYISMFVELTMGNNLADWLPNNEEIFFSGIIGILAINCLFGISLKYQRYD